MHGLLITDPNCHLPAGVLSRFRIDRLNRTDDFAERLLDQWLFHSDALLAVGSQPQLESWQRVVAKYQPQFAERRLSAQLKRPFHLRLFGNRHRYAALGVVVSAVAESLEQDWNLDAIRVQMEQTEAQVQHYLALPAGAAEWNGNGSSLLQLWRRNKAGVVQYQQDQRRRIVSSDKPVDALLELGHKLAPPSTLFNLSYAGDPAVLQTQNAFQHWHQQIQERGGQCWLSAMDDISAQQCGDGALSLAWLSAPARRETP